jgi:hypothetical protein
MILTENRVDLTACVLFPPPMSCERCNTLQVPSVLDSRCIGEVNPAPRSTREEPFATRTNLESEDRALGRNRQLLVRVGRHPDGEQVPAVQSVKANRCVEIDTRCKTDPFVKVQSIQLYGTARESLNRAGKVGAHSSFPGAIQSISLSRT